MKRLGASRSRFVVRQGQPIADDPIAWLRAPDEPVDAITMRHEHPEVPHSQHFIQAPPALERMTPVVAFRKPRPHERGEPDREHEEGDDAQLPVTPVHFVDEDEKWPKSNRHGEHEDERPVPVVQPPAAGRQEGRGRRFRGESGAHGLRCWRD